MHRYIGACLQTSCGIQAICHSHPPLPRDKSPLTSSQDFYKPTTKTTVTISRHRSLNITKTKKVYQNSTARIGGIRLSSETKRISVSFLFRELLEEASQQLYKVVSLHSWTVFLKTTRVQSATVCLNSLRSTCS